MDKNLIAVGISFLVLVSGAVLAGIASSNYKLVIEEIPVDSVSYSTVFPEDYETCYGDPIVVHRTRVVNNWIFERRVDLPEYRMCYSPGISRVGWDYPEVSVEGHSEKIYEYTIRPYCEYSYVSGRTEPLPPTYDVSEIVLIPSNTIECAELTQEQLDLYRKFSVDVVKD